MTPSEIAQLEAERDALRVQFEQVSQAYQAKVTEVEAAKAALYDAFIAAQASAPQAQTFAELGAVMDADTQ